MSYDLRGCACGELYNLPEVIGTVWGQISKVVYTANSNLLNRRKEGQIGPGLNVLLQICLLPLLLLLQSQS
jgi:hypothetical protein